MTGSGKASAIDEATKVAIIDVVPNTGSRVTNWRQE